MTGMNTNRTRTQDDRAATVEWLTTQQAAVMAQLDEQTRGQAAGLVPGSNDANALEDWIEETYGPLPTADHLGEATPTAQQAGRVRAWQARRLADSALLVVEGPFQALAARLAASGGFTRTPALPAGLPSLLTVCWPAPYTGYGTVSVAGPGGLPGESSVCAITIDQEAGRIIEWTPTGDLELSGGVASILDRSGAMLPPWLVAADVPIGEDDRDDTGLRAAILAAHQVAGHLADGHASLLEQANALVAAVRTGLVSVRKDAEGYLLAAPDSRSV